MTGNNKIRDAIESAIPYVMPAIGGFAGLLWVNLQKMQFYNPMIWIPLGIFLGWAAGRGLLKLLSR